MPKMTAEQSTETARDFYAGIINNSKIDTDSLEMENIFGDIWSGIKNVGGFITGKLPCLASCGINALPCIKCGTNLGCWAKCAGPEAISCISGCLS